MLLWFLFSLKVLSDSASPWTAVLQGSPLLRCLLEFAQAQVILNPLYSVHFPGREDIREGPRHPGSPLPRTRGCLGCSLVGGDQQKECENRAGSEGQLRKVLEFGFHPRSKGELHRNTVFLPGAPSKGGGCQPEIFFPCSRPGERSSCRREDAAILSHLPTARLPPRLLP